MIAYLKGTILDILPQSVICVVNDVGYRVYTSAENFLVGQQVEMYIQTVVSENSITYWGFASKAEHRLFEMLISVSGVGPKTAANMIAELGVEQIIQSIMQGSHLGIRSKGVGEKTAQKVVIDLKQKISEFQYEVATNSPEPSDWQDAKSALVSLGYSANEVEKAMQTAEISASDSVEMIIKKVLTKV